MGQSANTYQPSLFAEPSEPLWPDNAQDFQEGFAELIGHPPIDLGVNVQAVLVASYLQTPLGGMIAVTDRDRLHLLEFAGRRALRSEIQRLSAMVRGRIGIGRSGATDLLEGELAAYFAGKLADFTVPLVMHGTAFQRLVWQELRHIPVGQVCSYSDIATRIGRPSATRAVARANGANQIAVLIPCHRVIGVDGSLTGYGGGLWRKQELLRIESDKRR